MNRKASHIVFALFMLAVCFLSGVAVVNYPGHKVIYIIFTVALNALFILGVAGRKMLFDTFIGIFFWLGFWLKLSVRVAFAGGVFQEPVGGFDGTGAAFDHALIITTCGVAALLAASLVRRRFVFPYEKTAGACRHESTFAFYKRHRSLVMAGFCGIIAAAGVMNVMLGIYQRGSIPRTFLPFGANGILTWLLLFGLASFSAVILDFEFRLKKSPYLATMVSLGECFVSNVSMLSRGMVLNGGSLIIGAFKNAGRRSLELSTKYKAVTITTFIILFVLSVFAANQVRKELFFSYSPQEMASPVLSVERKSAGRPAEVGSPGRSPEAPVPLAPPLSARVSAAIRGVRVLVIDRWVGIEGVMAVSSYENRGWDLWKRAWTERFSHSGTSIYDREILEYKYSSVHLSRHHFINIPGILAFLYYPGSYSFLFISMLLVGFVGAGIEFVVYRLGGANIILCSLLAQVVAYRYSHFGYAPNQSYLLFGSLFLNVLIIWFIEKALLRTNKRRAVE